MEYGHLRHPVREVRKWTRAEWRRVGNVPAWKQWREVEHDRLAYRALILAVHGLGTLQNVIAGDHGLPNRH